MKEKIIYIIISILFIGTLVGISIVANKKQEQTKTTDKTTDSVIKITSENFEEEVLKSEKRVLIDFYAEWCGPCKIVSPIVSEIAKENKDIKVVKIDVDKNNELSDKYKIISVPTLIVIENGKEINRAVGALSKDRILKFVREAKQ